MRRQVTAANRQWWVMAAMSLVMIVLTMDFFGLTVALPTIGQDLDASTATLEWTVNAYLLAIAAPLIAVGRLADLVGRRRILVVGTILFAAASTACGLAPDDWFLIGARVVQGVGGSMILATSLSIVSNAFTDAQRGLGIGIWSAVGSIGSAIGPFVGGFLTETLSWRWFFFVNVPVSVLAIALVFASVEESRDESARGVVDRLGFVWVTLGFVLVILGLQQGPELGWSAPVVVTALAGGAVVLGLFVRTESRRADPLVDLGLFRNAPYFGASCVAFLGQWVFGAVMFLLTLYLQEVLDLSPIGAGFVFLTFTIPFAVLSPYAGRLVPRTGAPRLMAFGMAVIAVGLACFAFIDASSGVGLVVAGMVVTAIGEAFAYNISSTAGMDAVSDQEAGIASGVLSTSRFVGMVVGLAVTGALFRELENRELARLSGAELDDVRGLLSGSDAAQRQIAELAPAVREQAETLAHDAFVTGLRGAMILCAVLAAAAVPLALVGRRPQRQR